MGEEFSAKDFRTWAGTVLAARAFSALGEEAASQTSLKRAVEEVAKQLGNTPTVCRNCYIHPDIVDSYLDGSLAEQLASRPTTSSARTAGCVPMNDSFCPCCAHGCGRRTDVPPARPPERHQDAGFSDVTLRGRLSVPCG